MCKSLMIIQPAALHPPITKSTISWNLSLPLSEMICWEAWTTRWFNGGVQIKYFDFMSFFFQDYNFHMNILIWRFFLVLFGNHNRWRCQTSRRRWKLSQALGGHHFWIPWSSGCRGCSCIWPARQHHWGPFKDFRTRWSATTTTSCDHNFRWPNHYYQFCHGGSQTFRHAEPKVQILWNDPPGSAKL